MHRVPKQLTLVSSPSRGQAHSLVRGSHRQSHPLHELSGAVQDPRYTKILFIREVIPRAQKLSPRNWSRASVFVTCRFGTTSTCLVNSALHTLQSQFTASFYHERNLNSSNAFSACNEMITCCSFPVMWCITLMAFSVLNLLIQQEVCIPGINLTRS